MIDKGGWVDIRRHEMHGQLNDTSAQVFANMCLSVDYIGYTVYYACSFKCDCHLKLVLGIS